jgi:tetratricopeptide (TPR) repeat protein
MNDKANFSIRRRVWLSSLLQASAGFVFFSGGIAQGQSGPAANPPVAEANTVAPSAKISGVLEAFRQAERTASPVEALERGLELLEACRGEKRHDLVEQYQAEVAAVEARTGKDGQVRLAVAKSIQSNLRDIGRARAEYTAIVENPNAVPEASAGALLQIAQIEHHADRAPSKAIETYDRIIREHPTLATTPDAYLGKMRAGMAIKDNSLVRRTVNELVQARQGDRRARVALSELAGYEFTVVGDRFKALKYWGEAGGFAINAKYRLESPVEGDLAVAQARIRFNDERRDGQFAAAIEEYQAVLRDYPKLSSAGKDWCITQTGIYQYQLGNETEALNTLQGLMDERQEGLSSDVRAKVALHIAAIKDPLSREAMIARFDRGLRWQQVPGLRDLCWREWFVWLEQSKRPEFEQWATDMTKTADERADLLWKKGIVLWEVGFDHSELCPLMDRILDEVKPTGTIRHHALYMKAYHQAHIGNYGGAAQIYRGILDETQQGSPIIEHVYRELAHCQAMGGEHLGALLTAEEFQIVYPWRTENLQFRGLVRVTLDNKPELSEILPGEVERLRARLHDRAAIIRSLALPVPPQPSTPQTVFLPVSSTRP